MPSSELRERMKKIRLAKSVDLEQYVPLEQYLKNKKRQLIAGVVLGIVMSAAAMFIAVKLGLPLPKVPIWLEGFLVEGFLLGSLSFVVRFAIRKNVNSVSRPPGSFLLSVSGFFCSRKTQEEIATQVIADMRIEYSQALFERRKMKARWIRIRYCWIFVCAVGLHRVLNVIADIILKRSSH